MKLSRRLEAVASYALPGVPLADVGTDHGYVPIFLVREKRIPSAIALDVRTGPLERASCHIREYGLCGQIEVRQSDGLEAVRPGEVGQILIAGMGGSLMARILAEGGEVLRREDFRRLILSPQSEIPLVRREMARSGFAIREEHVVKDDGKYYFILIGEPGECDYRSEADFRLGKRLTESREEAFLGYLEEKLERNDAVLTALKRQAEDGNRALTGRIGQLEEEQKLMREISRLE